jgi:hypothetical protein
VGQYVVTFPGAYHGCKCDWFCRSYKFLYGWVGELRQQVRVHMSERNESCWRAIQFAGSGYYTSRSHKLNLASHQWTTLVRMSFYVAFLKFKNHIFLFFSMTTVTVLQTTLLMYTVAAGCFNWYITRKSCFGIFFTASTQRIFGVDFAVDLEEGELEAERLPVVYTTIEDGLGMIILFRRTFTCWTRGRSWTTGTISYSYFLHL